MTMPTDVALPAAVVEAAAEVLSVDATGFFYFNGEDWREKYRDLARKALTAALGVCEVREQWGAHLWYDGEEDDGFDTWLEDRTHAEARVESHTRHRAANPPEEDTTARRWHGNARLIHRLTIETPAEPDPSAGQP